MTFDFASLDLPTLQSMQTDLQACLKAILVGQQSYSIAGRTFTRANLAEVGQMIEAVGNAIGRKNGTIVRTTYADMSGC